MAAEARPQLRASRPHVAAYLEYLQLTGRRHDQPLLPPAEVERLRAQASAWQPPARAPAKLTEAEELAIYEQRYQQRVRRAGGP